MRRPLLAAAFLLPLLALPTLSRQQQAPHVVETDPLSPEKERQQFVLPPGFEAQLVAAEPDIHKPMNIAFDDQGRLWVTDTVEYPFPAKPGAKTRDTVKVLSDFAPDGKARKIVTFADNLNIPIGVLPLPGASPRDTLVFSIPNIYRLRDTTGKSVADQRSIAYGTYEFRDTHGMTNNFLHGLDGWVYACHGYNNRSTIKGGDGQAITMQSGNTYRLRPDGSHLEQFTWGQVNPFGMTVDPLGYLYTSDCHSEPIYQLIRGGYYPSFGKPHDGLGFAPTMFTGYKGSTAVAGIAYYDADMFPAAYRNSAFVGDVMTNQVVEFKIAWKGASPSATQHVLMDCKDRWFRPVDVKLGPDGALYVADFYNRIIGHYEVPLLHPGRDRERGRIWRIVYKGKDAKPTPARGDWTKANVKDLVSDLGHPNIVVRHTAAHQLVRRGNTGVITAVQKSERPEALHVLERLGWLDYAALKAAADKGGAAHVHALRILAERPEWNEWERARALDGLQDANAHVQRAGADALGLHPDAANVSPLLALRHKVPSHDTHLLHTVRIALRNQLRMPEGWKVASSKQDKAAIADVAPGVPSRESAAFLLEHFQGTGSLLSDAANLVQHVARYGDAKMRQSLVAFAREEFKKDVFQQSQLFRAVERGTQEAAAPLPEDARAWGVDLARRLIGSKRSGDILQGIELTRILRLGESQKRLTTLARQPDTRPNLRNAALDALIAIDAGKHAATCGDVLANAALPVESREHAARLLAQANQAKLLVAALPTAPARLQNSIAAGLAGSRDGVEVLFQAIAAGKASARLLQEPAVVFRLAVTKPPMLKERLAKLTAGLPAADANLAQLLASRRKSFLAAKADAAKGAAVFEKSCANCHQVGGKGAKVGPQLDGIGLRGLDRLLEDTLDPNRNVDEAFRTTKLVLTSGKSLEGLFLREEGAVLVLADNQGKDVRVGKKDVEERSVSPLSPMPANLAEQITEADFHHLLAYLLSLKPPKP